MISRFIPRYRVGSKVAWVAAVAGVLAWPTTNAGAQAQVSVTGVFSSYTGGIGAETLINGVPVSGPTVTNYAFTPSAQVDFVSGTGFANRLSFIPAAPQLVANVGDEFLLGRITYTNGDWVTNGSAFGVRFTTSSTTTAFNGHVFNDSFVMVVTGNTASQTPLQNADFVYFAGRPDLGSIRVFEAFDSPGRNTGSVAFYGRIGSLIPSRFADALGGATIVSSVAPDPSTVVPEPSTVALMASGLGMLMLMGRRRLRKQH